MKNLINKSLEAILILLIVFILGLFVPMLITTLVVIFTKTTYCEVFTTSVVFWIFTIIGWVIAAIFVNDEIDRL
jgi:hypothetical protein